jgi:hypothetical protein
MARKLNKKAVAATIFIGGGLLLLWLWERGQANGQALAPSGTGNSLFGGATSDNINSLYGNSEGQTIFRAGITHYEDLSAPVPDGGCCGG